MRKRRMVAGWPTCPYLPGTFLVLALKVILKSLQSWANWDGCDLKWWGLKAELPICWITKSVTLFHSQLKCLYNIHCCFMGSGFSLLLNVKDTVFKMFLPAVPATWTLGASLGLKDPTCYFCLGANAPSPSQQVKSTHLAAPSMEPLSPALLVSPELPPAPEPRHSWCCYHLHGTILSHLSQLLFYL